MKIPEGYCEGVSTRGTHRHPCTVLVHPCCVQAGNRHQRPVLRERRRCNTCKAVLSVTDLREEDVVLGVDVPKPCISRSPDDVFHVSGLGGEVYGRKALATSNGTDNCGIWPTFDGVTPPYLPQATNNYCDVRLPRMYRNAKSSEF